VFATTNIIAADKAAVATINSQGGILGHKLVLDYCNDKGDPNQTATCGRQMVSDQVVMEAGGNILNGPQLTPILKAASIAQVGIQAISPAELNASNVFLFNGTVPGYLFDIGYAAAHKIPLAMVISDNPTATSLDQLLQATSKKLGNPFTGTTLVSPTAPDMSIIAQSVVSSHPKGVIELLGNAQAAQFFTAMGKIGAPQPTYQADYFSPALASINGGSTQVDKIITASNFPPFDSTNPVIKEFDASMAAEAGRGDGDAALGTQNGGSMASWLSLWTLQQMAKRGLITASTLNAAGILKAFSAAKAMNMNGIIPPWTPSAAGPTGLSRVSNPYYYLWQYTSGGAHSNLLVGTPVSYTNALAGKF
jgi:ABC-type branched-subunit amino acid transport system substrate-binding protein